MSTNEIVDLSADDCNDEAWRKKINRKKMNELKRYIPFLEYIAELDPVKNRNYKQLLMWLTINKEFPARMAATCENNIIMKYNKIKSTTELPPHIVEVFTEKDAILISDEDDEQPTPQNSTAQLSKTLETIELEDDELSDSSSRTALKNDQPPSQASSSATALKKDQPPSHASSSATALKKFEPPLQASSTAGVTEATDLPSSTGNSNAANKHTENTSLSTSIPSAITLPSPATERAEDSQKPPLEEGEIPSDEDDIKENRDKNETQSKNTQKITTKTLESKISPTADDIINQDLFKRIDCFEENDYLKPLNKEKDEETKITILRQKNLGSGLFTLKSSKNTRSESLSTISSEDTFEPSSHKKKKKKKKHKHKKKNHDASDGEDNSERGEKLYSRDRSNGEDKIKKPKKSKKRNKDHKQFRLLYISDDGEDEVSAINKNNNSLAENSSDSNRTHDFLHAADADGSEPPTVVLSDSNDEEVGQLCSVQENSAEKPVEPVSKSVENVSSPKTATEPEPAQNNEPPSIAPSMEDINNMNLTELNNIYSTLCDATGIQLEELLIDLVGKSTEANKPSPKANAAEKSTPVAEANFEMVAPPEIHMPNNSDQHSQFRPENMNMYGCFQQQQYQYNQNLPTYLCNLSMSEMQSQSYMNMQCQMPDKLPYRHNLRPGLNLNDPRIVQRLKQIKDSPIHNINIRESASLLVSRHIASMPNRPLPPPPEVTSQTAKTYGEHKRLRELEKKRELERQARKTATTTLENLPAIGKDEQQEPAKTTKEKVDKSEAEKRERNWSKSVKESGEEVADSSDKTIMSFSLNRSRSLPEDSSEKKAKLKENISSAIGPVSDDTTKKLKNLSNVQFESKSNQEDDANQKSPEKLSNSLETPVDTKDNPTDGMRAKKRGRPASKKRNESSDGSKKSPSKPFGMRELNNLNCTFLEYQEIFEKNSLTTYGGKRRCSVFPNHIRDQSSSEEISQNSDDQTGATSDKLTAAPIQRRRQTCSALQDNTKPKKDNLPPLKVVFRRISEGSFGIESPGADTDECGEVEIKKQPEPFQLQEVKVKLKKLSVEEIKTQTNVKKNISKASDSNRGSSERTRSKSPCRTNFSEEPILVPFSSEPVNCLTKSYSKPLRHLNDNINMTLNSTKVCVICNKRSLDLTSHYVLQHKTESYISRLTSAEIENLESQIKLATLNRKRYRTTCVFCEDALEVNYFVQFHAHFSYHTGEYGFKCDVCEVVKPYREDVKSHQLRTSRCRNGKVRTNYLYQTDIKVIYLYICKLCNFVQLNEANIHKHQRDHHSLRFEEPQHVKKCIICALDDVQVINELLPTNEMEALEAGSVYSEYNESGREEQEQEIVHEFPLDIKDVLSLENENNLVSQEKKSLKFGESDGGNKVSTELPTLTSNDDKASTQKNRSSGSTQSTVKELVPQLDISTSLDKQMTEIHGGKENTNCASATASEHIAPPSTVQLLNAKNPIKLCMKPLEDLPFRSSKDSSPLLLHNTMTFIPDIEVEPKYGNPSGNHSVMTIVHRTERTSCVEFHQPYEETPDVKPNINEIKIENTEVSVSSPPSVRQIAYRKVNPGVNFFGLYKCMRSDCWFSTNEAEKYVRHVDTHKVNGEKFMLYCAYCSSKSFCPKQLVRHVRTRHSMSLYQCSVCTYRSMLAGNVYFHIEMNHGDVAEEKCIYKCVGRIRTLENKLATLKDKIKERVSRLVCRDCPTQYYSLSLMKSHIETTHHTISQSTLMRYACIFCELESNSLAEMQTHLVTLHPNDMCYIVERELNNETDKDSIENLKLVKLTPSIMKRLKVRVADFKEEVPKEVQTTNKLELKIIERMSPYLELITENTGVYRSELYKCTVCGGSFFTHDLWLSHVQSRHNINDKVTCPFCPQQISLEEVIVHFETHLRHEYLCFHCVKTFGSRLELEDHFDANHRNFEKVIEKPILYSNLRKYYIMKGDEPPSPTDWMPILENFIEALRNRYIEKLYENRHSEWCCELVQPCFEDIDIPQFLSDSGMNFKCLVNSCPFATPDEEIFDLHLNQHTVPNNYDCSCCAKNVNSSWECIKDHYMLHRRNILYLCCVCKFVHHNRSTITQHIQKLHNSRDVPIVTLWRESTKCKISLSIVTPTNKTGFVTTTTCFCCGQGMVNGKGVMKHLFDVHGIVLSSKCELCGDILLHREEIERHSEKHGSTILAFRYDILSSSLYNLCVTSVSPFRIDVKRKVEKRKSQDVVESTSKQTKLDEVVCVNIKPEIIEGEGEDLNMNGNFEKPSCSIKCVNIDQLVSDTCKPISNQPTRGLISVKSFKDLQEKPPQVYPAGTANYHVQQSNNPKIQSTPQMAPPDYHIPSQRYLNYNSITPSVPNKTNQVAQPQQVQILPNTPPTNSVSQYYSNNNISSVIQQHTPHFRTIQHTSSLPAQIGPSSIPYQQTDLQAKRSIMNIPLPVNQVATVTLASPAPSFLPAQVGTSTNIQSIPNLQGIPTLQQGPQNNIIKLTVPLGKGTATVSRGLPPPYASSSYSNGPHCSYQINKTVTPSNTYQLSSSLNNTKQIQTLNQNQAESTVTTMADIAKTVDLSYPEILPICGVCKLESNNFFTLLSHFHAVHESKSRFIFCIVRRVECVYCPYRGSIPSLTPHNNTFHPGKAVLCRSVIDHSRCGICHGIFSFNPTPNNPILPKCNCPMRTRVLADCINLDSLHLLQKFGKRWYGFSCPICNKLFQSADGCSNHIKTMHNQSGISPKMWPVKCFLLYCFMCETTAMSFQKIIMHINTVHNINRNTCTLDERLLCLRKVRLIYPRGLMVSLSDLINAGYDEEILKKDIQTVDALYRNEKI